MTMLNKLWKSKPKSTAQHEQYGTAFFNPVHKLLYFTGLSASNRSFLYQVYSVTIRFLFALLVIIELYSIVYFISISLSIDQGIEILNVTAIHLTAMYRYRTMLKHKELYNKLAMSMESPYFDLATPNRRNILKYWINKNRKYSTLLLALGSCTILAWDIYPLVDDLDYNLLVPLQLPFNYATPTLYSITYGVVLVACNYAGYFVIVNDLIMQSHLMHLLCQFVVLQDCFQNILEDCIVDFKDINQAKLHLHNPFIRKYNNRLGDLVEQHKLILRNTFELRNILSIPMLYQISGSSMLICFVAYQAMAIAVSADITKMLMCLLYLGYNMFQLLIFCRWCDEIKVQVLSEAIRQAVYFSGWESMLSVPGVGKRLMLVVARASRPLEFTAGGVYSLSLSSYATIVKTSYSALSVLLSARH